MNLKRMSAALQHEVLKAFQQYITAEGGNPGAVMAKVADIALRPDLFSRLLADDLDFRGLSVIVIPIADDPHSPKRTRQIAFVRPGARILSVEQGSSEATFYMPAWLTD